MEPTSMPQANNLSKTFSFKKIWSAEIQPWHS
jgi:hypothetical protein